MNSDNNFDKEQKIEKPCDAYEGDRPYIFVSYAHMDVQIVFPEIKRFHDEGYHIWYDKGLTPGQEWDDEIAEALLNSSLLVVFLSENSMKSTNVQDEIKLALEEKIDVVPIYIEKTKLSPGLRLRLSNKHAIFKYKMDDEDYLTDCFRAFNKANISKINFEPKLENLVNKPTAIKNESVEENIKDTVYKTDNISVEHKYHSNKFNEEEIRDTFTIENNYIEHISTKKQIVTECLKEFNQLNTTTEIATVLENYDVLIILDDGTNLTSYDDLEDKNQVLYINEDLSGKENLINYYQGYENVKLIIADGIMDNVTILDGMFSGCSSLIAISSLFNWDTSNVISMEYMFSGCSSLVDISPLSRWDTSNVIQMVGLFNGCSSLEDFYALFNWDVSQVKDMESMFSGCSSLVELSVLECWNTSNLATVNYMFRDCSSLLDISALSNWNTSKLEYMWRMFEDCSSLEDVSALENWEISRKTTMWDMFDGCKKIQGYPHWYNNK